VATKPPAASVAIGPVAAIVRADFGPDPGFERLGEGPTDVIHGVYSMFISPAYAQGSSLNDLVGIGSPLPMMVIVVVIFYILVLRPQQKRAKEHQELVKNLRRGDTVYTSGGLVGKVTKLVDDEQVEIEIADGVRVRQVRSMVSSVRAKGEPRDDGSAS
jgi:preprotein translocase subunit YajC